MIVDISAGAQDEHGHPAERKKDFAQASRFDQSPHSTSMMNLAPVVRGRGSVE